MESRTTPIQEGEDDEDFATPDTLTPSSFPSCNSSPTQLPHHSRIQQTCRQCFDHNVFIQHPNRGILDSLERGRRRRRFRSGPSSRFLWINLYVSNPGLKLMLWAPPSGRLQP